MTPQTTIAQPTRSRGQPYEVFVADQRDYGFRSGAFIPTLM
jgi:hypothetical protein